MDAVQNGCGGSYGGLNIAAQGIGCLAAVAVTALFLRHIWQKKPVIDLLRQPAFDSSLLAGSSAVVAIIFLGSPSRGEPFDLLLEHVSTGSQERLKALGASAGSLLRNVRDKGLLNIHLIQLDPDSYETSGGPVRLRPGVATYPACSAGVNRSQMFFHVLRERFPEHPVSAPHGIIHSYDQPSALFGEGGDAGSKYGSVYVEWPGDGYVRHLAGRPRQSRVGEGDPFDVGPYGSRPSSHQWYLDNYWGKIVEEGGDFVALTDRFWFALYCLDEAAEAMGQSLGKINVWIVLAKDPCHSRDPEVRVPKFFAALKSLVAIDG